LILSPPSNYMNRSGSESNGHSQSDVLEVATCRSPVWCWVDMWCDLEEVKNWPL